MVIANLVPVRDGLVRRPCVELQRIMHQHWGVNLAEPSVSQLLKESGFARDIARA